MGFIQCLLYSLIIGLAEILPVSAEAHRMLLFKIYGIKADQTTFLDLLIHVGILGGLYFSNLSHIVRISKARHLARIPKRRRRRPLDTRSLMDFSLLRTMAIPLILCLLMLPKVADLTANLPLMAIFLLINGIILYVPQFLPSSNRDARTLNPLHGILIGIGGGIAILPGISAMGTSTSVAAACGVERKYGLDMALMLEMVVVAGHIFYDITLIAGTGLGMLSFALFLQYLICGVFAALVSVLAVKLMRYLAANFSFTVFGFYCIGLSLFTFILNLMA